MSLISRSLSQKRPTVGLTIFSTNVVEKVGNQLHFIFPPHLTSASALPGEIGNPKIASFHLNAACFFTKKTRNTVKNITWSELNHPSLSKPSTGCTRQEDLAVCYPHALC